MKDFFLIENCEDETMAVIWKIENGNDKPYATLMRPGSKEIEVGFYCNSFEENNRGYKMHTYQLDGSKRLVFLPKGRFRKEFI